MWVPQALGVYPLVSGAKRQSVVAERPALTTPGGPGPGRIGPGLDRIVEPGRLSTRAV